MSSSRVSPMRRAVGSVGALALGCLGLCAAAGAVAQEPVEDPLEPLNRTIHSFNDLLDLMFIEPASIVYGHLPDTARMGVRNVLNNLREPVTVLNDALQGEGDRAGLAFGRFMINTLVGMGGLFDFATEFGYPRHVEDFGQTLGRWGVGPGPYLVLPVLGPSTVRDTAGLGVDYVAGSPLPYNATLEMRAGRTAADGVDTRYRLTPVINDVRANSLDPYATFRSAYLQRRAAEIRNSEGAPTDSAYEELFDETDVDAPPP
jgi:phospholipid-binding lipoprotein MlaA